MGGAPRSEQHASRPLTPHAASPGWLSRERALALVLLAATLLALYLCYLLVQPFLPALAWALALAVVAQPVYGWLLVHIARPGLAAALAVVLVSLLLIAPTLFVLHAFIREIAQGVEHLQTEDTAGWWRAIVAGNPRFAPALHWLGSHVDLRTEVERGVALLTARLPSFVTGSLWAFVELLIILFCLFFFFRDRPLALRALRALVPLSDSEASEVFRRVADTIHATIYGTMVVGIVQGTLGGLMFWWLGLPTPLVWGMAMALLALVPILGTFVVWIPAAIFLALDGHWGKALMLTGWGGLVIALVDNMLYPFLVGERLRLHTLLVFVAMLGGVTVLGASGLILGPVILAITLALMDIWSRRTAGGRAVG
ncbi:MAG: AI-2E family transporter [Candidatus Tectimicrobiota bacterium]